MQRIYYYIALLVLYGDLLKRWLPASVALMMLYGLAAVILLAIAVKRRKLKNPASLEGRIVFMLSLILVLIYILQLLTSFSSPFVEGVSHTIYMCIPLLYIVVILKFCPQFDLVALGKTILILMVPVNMVGLVQYFIDPNFLISTAYSGELGGVILRNFLEAGVFSRYPSLFASADRYSAMGLMQFFFTLVVLKGSSPLSRKGKYWLAFNLISAGAALFIAGARSRILIALVAVLFMALTFILGVLFSKSLPVSRALKRYFPMLTATMVVVLIVIGNWSLQQEEEKLSFPVLTMLAQSIEQGDISNRIDEAAAISMVSEEITLFGHGLGTIAHGKPGEFGIKSMWIESGIFWGSLMVLTFTGIIVALCLVAWRSFLAFEPLNVVIFAIPILLLIFAVLAGLTSAFELSSGVLLGCAIAVISRSPRNITGGSSMPLPPQANKH